MMENRTGNDENDEILKKQKNNEAQKKHREKQKLLKTAKLQELDTLKKELADIEEKKSMFEKAIAEMQSLNNQTNN